MSYTDEQLAYITYEKSDHTKLLACAGAGKTRCIIARISHLLKTKTYKPDEILMLTFSRFTRDDFMHKIRSYTKPGQPCIPPTSVKTIDSFAKQIIDPNNTVDVSLLSYRFMLFLEDTPAKNLNKIEILKRIKMVFVDEAQDLNEIQYRIFSKMREKLGTVINMVGDPNQNIYQFRHSSDKYLTQFDAKVFQLTKNFRSHKSVVEFSKHLRPFTEYDVICSKGDNNCQPILMFYKSEKILEKNIVDILQSALAENMDLSEFAILAPTRGRMRGGGKSHGLCFVSNVLFKAGIKFKQFYEETVDEVSGEGIKYAPKKDHVNVLTFMGSKGLEWKYVLLIDADMCLINKRYFDKEKHDNDRYLLYVACSRAIHNMYIFSKCYWRSGEPHFKTNPWFEKVPSDLYKLDENYKDHFFWPELRYIDMMEKDTSLSKVIEKLSCYDLDEISKIIDYQNVKPIRQKKIFKTEYTDIDKVSGVFLARYVSNLFHGLMSMSEKSTVVKFPEIESIIDSDTMVTGASDEVSLWYYRNRKGMTWDKFDRLNNINEHVKNFINENFKRNKKFDAHTLAINGYYELFILGQKKWIRNLYKKYLRCKNSAQMRDILFYLTVIIHSINTHHYFHIKSKGKIYKGIMNDFSELYEELETYVEDMDHDFSNSAVSVSRWGFLASVDIVDSNNHIWITKCTSDISLKNVIFSIALNLMHDKDLVSEMFEVNDIAMFRDPTNITDLSSDDDSNDDSNNSSSDDSETNNSNLVMKTPKARIRTSFINFLRGEELEYEFNLGSNEIKRIIEILINNMGKTKEPNDDSNDSTGLVKLTDTEPNSLTKIVNSVMKEEEHIHNEENNNEIDVLDQTEKVVKSVKAVKAVKAVKTKSNAKAKGKPIVKPKVKPKAKAKARTVSKRPGTKVKKARVKKA
jgi:Mimiviridae putative ATP-dependent DNA helicase